MTDNDPVLVRGAVQFDLASSITDRTYRIFVFKPAAPPPPEGYPVVVVLDGNLTFATAATQSGAFGLRGGRCALVVGVGYPVEDDFSPVFLRNRDLTPATETDDLPRHSAAPPPRPEDYGGAEAFYRFLTEELRPAIAAAFPVDPADQSLYGHSLAGLFALGVLFGHPEAFRTFVVSSPSIWWNRRAVLAGEAAFAAKVEAGEAAPRVLVMVGEHEEQVPETPLPGMTRAEMETLMAESRMVGNAADLAARLAAIQGGPGYQVRYQLFQDEDHLTVLPASISRALTFALRG